MSDLFSGSETSFWRVTEECALCTEVTNLIFQNTWLNQHKIIVKWWTRLMGKRYLILKTWYLVSLFYETTTLYWDVSEIEISWIQNKITIYNTSSGEMAWCNMLRSQPDLCRDSDCHNVLYWWMYRVCHHNVPFPIIAYACACVCVCVCVCMHACV